MSAGDDSEIDLERRLASRFAGVESVKRSLAVGHLEQ